jgi:nitroreductase
MQLQEAIRNRRSIRQFSAKSVSADLIRDLITDALWSPSWGNTQPWEVVVATGQKLAEFKKKNQEALLSGKEAATDIPMPQVSPGNYLTRYKELGKSVLGALAIARDDKEARLQHFVKMFSAAMVSYPEIARELFSVPQSKLFVMGAALGWPDPEAPVNRFERKRGALDEFVRWVK